MLTVSVSVFAIANATDHEKQGWHRLEPKRRAGHAAPGGPWKPRLAVILGGTGEAARDPFSPACEKYAYKPPSDTRTLARLKQECARFLAAGIRKGVAANDQWDVQALLGWARRTLQVCSDADDPLACATKLDTVPGPAPRPKSQAPPAVPPVPKDEVPKPSPTRDAGAGGAIFAVVLVAGLIILILAFLSKAGPVVASTNSPDRCPRCGSPYFHQEPDHGDLWICDGPGCGLKFEAGRKGTATQESVQGGEKPTEETRDDLARLKVEQIRLLVNEAVRAGYIFVFEPEGTMLSTAEGYNRAGVAVLGAMVLNLGQPTFNLYCENQRRAIGWLQSRTNPIQVEARELRAKRRGNDPSVRSMLEDVEREFVAPLVAEHVKNGGQAPSVDEVEATCAMLLAKILWDAKLGNPDQAAALRMLGARLGTGASDAVSKKLFESGDRERQKREKFEELEEDGEEEFVNSQKATWLVSRGNHFGNEGMLDEALEDFEEALQLKSDHIPAHVSRALVYATRGEIDRAQKLLEETPDEMKLYGDVVARKQEVLNSMEMKTMLNSLGLRWVGIADEKGEFSVILISGGERRVEVFKELRAITGLSRKGVNDLLGGVPEPVKEGTTRAKAEEVKKRLEEAGATVKIKERRRPDRGETR